LVLEGDSAVLASVALLLAHAAKGELGRASAVYLPFDGEHLNVVNSCPLHRDLSGIFRSREPTRIRIRANPGLQKEGFHGNIRSKRLTRQEEALEGVPFEGRRGERLEQDDVVSAPLAVFPGPISVAVAVDVLHVHSVAFEVARTDVLKPTLAFGNTANPNFSL